MAHRLTSAGEVSQEIRREKIRERKIVIKTRRKTDCGGTLRIVFCDAFSVTFLDNECVTKMLSDDTAPYGGIETGNSS